MAEKQGWPTFSSSSPNAGVHGACPGCADLQRRLRQAQERAEKAEALAEVLVTDIGHWVMAYGPDLVVYPSKEELRAVNETPEFRIGRNATMQVVSEGLQDILKKAPAEALRRWEAWKAE